MQTLGTKTWENIRKFIETLRKTYIHIFIHVYIKHAKFQAEITVYKIDPFFQFLID